MAKEIRKYFISLQDEPLEMRLKLVDSLHQHGEEVLEDSIISHKANITMLPSFRYTRDCWYCDYVFDKPHLTIREFLKKFPIKPTINQMDL